MPPENQNSLRSSTATGVVIVAGKGGVGKTTVTAVLARAASRAGRHVLVVELDGKPTLDELVGIDSGSSVPVDVLHLSAPDALSEYLDGHGFGRIGRRLGRTGVIDVVGTATPGIDDVVVLGRIKQLDRAGTYDLILVDGPAAGHAVSFLTSATGLANAVRGGPVKVQADEVIDLLGDHDRCSVLLVTLPETTPVIETVETAFALEGDVGVRLGPIVINGIDSAQSSLPTAADVKEALAELNDPIEADALRAGWEFRCARRAMEEEAVDRLAESLPLGMVILPRLPVAGLSSVDVELLADELGTAWKPHRRYGPCSASDAGEGKKCS